MAVIIAEDYGVYAYSYECRLNFAACFVWVRNLALPIERGM
jgi:hypothetical protein